METFGIEYGYEGQVTPSIANSYTSINSKITKFADVCWGDTEPTAPFTFLWITSHNYNWSKLDSFINAWQTVAYTEYTFVVRSKCSWGTSPTIPVIPELSVYQNMASCPPTAKHMNNYILWLKELVSRYSGKVPSKTMPGLKYPVKYWEIESEAASPMFWLGTKDDYSNMLKAAYTTIKSIDPSATVLLSGINLNDMLKYPLTEEQMMSMINSKPAPWNTFLQNGIAFFRDNLRYSNYFDVIEFHSMHDYECIPNIVNQINLECDKAGCPRKPIWVGDATSTPHSTPSPVDFYPIPEPAASYNYIMWWPDNPQYPQASAWFLEEQSKLAIKKMALTPATGCQKIFMGTLIDWPWYSGYPYNGLVNTVVDPSTNKKSYTKKPVYNAMSYFISTFSGFTSCSYSTINGVWIVKFLFTNGRIGYVCWSENGQQDITLNFNYDSKLLNKFIETDYNIQKVIATNTFNRQTTVTVNDVPLIVVQS